MSTDVQLYFGIDYFDILNDTLKEDLSQESSVSLKIAHVWCMIYTIKTQYVEVVNGTCKYIY